MKSFTKFVENVTQKLKKINDRLTVKHLVIIFLSIVAACLVLSIATRFSYTDELYNLDVSNWGECPVETVDFDISNNPSDDVELDVLESADQIAKVKVLTDGKELYGCVYFKAEVLEVYNGDKSLVNQTIGVFQQNACFVKSGRGDKTVRYNNRTPFNLMVKDKEYYVWLYDRQFIPLYQEKYGVPTFLIVPEFYAVQPVDMGQTHWFESNDLKYKDVRDYAYVCADERTAENIENAAAYALKHFGIEN